VMTPASKDFVTPLTLATLSKNPVHFDFVNEDNGELSWNNHVELGKWADLMVVAPATASTLSKMAQGTCDNLLLATYLSCPSPVYVAPAMDLDMYAHPTTAATLKTLQNHKVHVIPVNSGFLASGLEGEGRMAEPEEIVAFIENKIRESLPLKGKKILVTAGPTRESIDPVRFLSNRSTGTMGYQIALKAFELGAEVVLISGPVCPIKLPSSIQRIEVESAFEMSSAVHKHFSSSDCFVSTAAVADFTPLAVAEHKIKKGENSLNIELKKTEDILASAGKLKSENQILIGFALESDNGVESAQSKLERKNLDAIALNSLEVKGAGFGNSTNQLTLFFKDSKQVKLPLDDKSIIASQFWEALIDAVL
ncbi:MAG: bifunctional phosphopantothenoylcysteine decarboxylase/phosphopantothenate--cysteine ligase CoaBC, partial [Flavobacteriaceae bacterium]